MATNTRFIPVPPETIWDVLADPETYAHWVVGSKLIRDVEDGWPAPGSKFHHTVGYGPLRLSDHTESLDAEPPRRLKIRAKGRPVGTADVTFELVAEAGGTTVRMIENPTGLFSPLALVPALHVATKLRNAETLTRLERLALRG